MNANVTDHGAATSGTRLRKAWAHKRIAVGLLAGIAGAGVVSTVAVAATADAATVSERRYVDAVERWQGHRMTKPHSVIAHGYMACDWMDAGYSTATAASMIRRDDPSIPYDLAYDEALAAGLYLC